MAKPPRIALWGWYGHRNTGDDALAATIAWGLNRFLGPCMLDIISTKKLVLPPGPAVRYLTDMRAVARIQMGMRVALSDISAIGGGSGIHDRGTALRRRLRLMRLGKWLGQQTVGLSVSIGPFGTAKGADRCRALLRRSVLMWVRDQRSLDFAESVLPDCGDRFLLAPDAALLIDDIGLPEPAVPSLNASRSLLVAPCDYHRFYVGEEQADLDTERRRRLAEALAEICRTTDIAIRLLVMNGSPDRGDGDACRTIAQALPADRVEIIPYDPNPLHAYRVIQQSTFVLGMRLHSLIYAFAAGVPFVALNYHVKVLDFLKTIKAALSGAMDAHEIRPHVLAQMVVRRLARARSDLLPKVRPEDARQQVRDAFRHVAERIKGTT